MGLIDSIIGAESGGNPDASNPNSSASGLGQFIDSTWLSTIRAHRPDLADKPDADLIALKSDPQLSREMTGAYAADNQAILAKAGVPVTPGSTYLAHFAGPQGAVKVLQADPSASAGSVLGDGVVRANPFLRNMSVADLQAWADRKMGGAQASAPQAGPAPVPQASPQVAPQAIPQAQAPMFPQAAPAAPQDASQALQIGQLQAPSIYYAPRRSPDLTALRAALANRAPIFPQG